MSVAGQAADQRRWPAALRWAACFALVLGAHAAAAAALIGHWHAQVESLPDAPAILVDMAPAPAAPPAPPSNVAPGPQQTPSAAVPDEPVEKTLETVAPPDEPAVEKTETVAPPPQPTLRDVVLPPHRPAERPQKHKQHRRQAHLASAPSAAARKAARAVAPAPGAQHGDPRAVPNWKSALVARLQRYKRYPAAAQARGIEGVAQLAFSVDRRGHVHRARIVRSSGSSLLDRATLALVARAEPLPPPPPQLRGAQIPIVVPIRYSMR